MSKSTNPEKSEVRKARVSRDKDGEAIGVAIFLSRRELVSLGVDVEIADFVSIEIDDEKLKVLSAGYENQGGDTHSRD